MKNFLLLPLLVAAGSLAIGAATTSRPTAQATTLRPVLTPDTLTVRGRITDFSKQQGLVGVTVLVKGTTVATSTDTAGHYKIKLPKGRRTVVVSLAGYDTQERKVTGRQLSVALKPSVHQLDEVVVSGTAPVQKRQEVSYSISQIESAPSQVGDQNSRMAPARKSKAGGGRAMGTLRPPALYPAPAKPTRTPRKVGFGAPPKTR